MSTSITIHRVKNGFILKEGNWSGATTDSELMVFNSREKMFEHINASFGPELPPNVPEVPEEEGA